MRNVDTFIEQAIKDLQGEYNFKKLKETDSAESTKVNVKYLKYEDSKFEFAILKSQISKNFIKLFD